MLDPMIEKLKNEPVHTFASLVEIMRLLRSDGGCPWDREQTHESIRSNLIEETYEVIEAIDTKDSALLREELGDVLLQVVFHARISEEDGDFSIDGVIHDVCAKLIHRHPHIFGSVQADTSEEVLANWEAIKTEEKNRVGLGGTLAAIPPSLPALMYAQKIIKKAGKYQASPGEDSALEALAAARQAPSPAEAVEKLLLGAAVIAQNNNLDSEEILHHACRRISTSLAEAENSELWQESVGADSSRRKLSEKVFFGE